MNGTGQASGRERMSSPSALRAADPRLRIGKWYFGPQALLRLAFFATALVYVQSVSFGWVYDDFPQIELNPWVHSFAHWRQFLTGSVWSFGSTHGNYYRPIFSAWLAGNYSLFGSMPGWWHLTSIAAHLLATGLVYLLACRLICNRWTAAAAAVLFGLNPLHVECVAWVSAVPEILVAIFFIAAFLACERWRESGRIAWAVLSCVLYGLALLSKETGLAFLPVLAVWMWNSLPRQAGRWRAWLLRLSPYLLVSAAYLAARTYALGNLSNSNYPRPWSWVVMTWPSALWLYLRTMLWPFPPRPAYDLDLVQRFSFAGVLFPLVLAAIVIAALALIVRARKLTAFSATWILMPLLPVLVGIHVFQWHDYAHDRYTYLPSVMIAIVVAFAFERLCELTAAKRALVIAAGVALAAAFALQTFRATKAWDSDNSMFARSYATAPHNPLAAVGFAQSLQTAGRDSDALALLHQVAQQNPNYWEANYILGLSYYHAGRNEEAEKYLSVATQVWPLEFFRPDGAQFYYLGLVQLQRGEDAAAEISLRKAIDVQPHAVSYRYVLASVLERLGRHQEAQEQLRIEAENRRLYVQRQKVFDVK